MTILNKVSNKTLMPGITAIPDVPDAPTIGAVTDLGTGTSASVAYTAAATGGTVTTFTATSTPGSITGTGTSPITVSGLTSGTSYTFKVKGTNATATGPESAASNSVTPVLPPSYESIATVNVSSSTSTVSFTSIPSTYKHLELRFITRCSRTSYTVAAIFCRFNGDTTANYSNHALNADGASAGSYGNANQSVGYAGFSSGANATANVFSGGIASILDYANTSKYKTVRGVSGFDQNAAGGEEIDLISSNWRSTSAITSIELTLETSANFLQYSTFALYGIKG